MLVTQLEIKLSHGDMATLNYRYHFHISVSETTAEPTASVPKKNRI